MGGGVSSEKNQPPNISARVSPPTASVTSRSSNRSFREIQFRHASDVDGANSCQPGPSAPDKPKKMDPEWDDQPGPSGSRKSNKMEGKWEEKVTPGVMERTKSDLSEFELPQYENTDDVILETFFHQDGKDFQCMYQAGRRYYLDSWQTQQWLPFPEQWKREGILTTNSTLNDTQPALSQSDESTPVQPATQARPVGDDREGYIDHPTRGRLDTYIFEEKRNVHYFYDNMVGSWLQLPVSWELHSEHVKKLMAPIEETLSDWRDRHDILAALRASNYNPYTCIENYLTIAERAALVSPKNAEDVELLNEKDHVIENLQKTVDQLRQDLEENNRQLQKEQQERRSAEEQIRELEDKVSSLEVEVKAAEAKNEALLQERPKTAPRSRSPEEKKTFVNPELAKQLNESMHHLHKEYLQLKMEATKRFTELQQFIKQLHAGMNKVFSSYGSQSQETNVLRLLYRKEAMQRKLLYNKLQELRGNIRVFARCRMDSRSKCCLQFPSDREILAPTGRKPFKFDKIFSPTSTQEQVFEDTWPVITSCVDGYNVCILAYGQTSSGKTYTMQGPPTNPGVNVRSLKELLKICNERDNVDYVIQASMVEIYNETIQDLLSSSTRTLDIRTHGNRIQLPGMKHMEVRTFEDIENIFAVGGENRKTAATKMNSESSRSHLICMITVEGHDRTSGTTSTGTLTLCDLAGSERVGKTEATGKRLVEAAAINKSLSALGQVFTALRTGQLHIPYRNSKLTHILQPSLGGDAKACMFVTVSPDAANLSETVSSLEFGSNARQVQLGQAKQNVQKRAPQVAPDNDGDDDF
ncbi:hypothetical protein NP493_162g04037 [Ridgeia piscesae]|uniref:Kinesin-like protein n=1 Tax=Ridgeia piscesae TaxID=27915 RepID=A0AAD9P3V9_RIDPI|nr:hypothetical protein NP493_162g04037 [Ridgeia piscesae]